MFKTQKCLISNSSCSCRHSAQQISRRSMSHRSCDRPSLIAAGPSFTPTRHPQTPKNAFLIYEGERNSRLMLALLRSDHSFSMQTLQLWCGIIR